jgi:hypothetical protein
MSVWLAVPPTLYAQSAEAKIAYQVSGEGQCDLVLCLGWYLNWTCSGSS